jgi:hypothetical protein
MMDARALESARNEVRQFLEHRWEILVRDENTFQFKYVSIRGIPWTCLAWINPQLSALFFRAIFMSRIDEGIRPLMAEYITRANYPLPDGCFALDYETGDLRFKSGVYFGGANLTRPLIRNVVESALEFVEMHVLGIVTLVVDGSIERALSANDDPANALERDDSDFEGFIRHYLRGMFIAAGLEDVTKDEIIEFQQYLIGRFRDQYSFGGYDGVPKDRLNDQSMRAMYAEGPVAWGSTDRGMAVVKAYKEELLRRRHGERDQPAADDERRGGWLSRWRRLS